MRLHEIRLLLIMQEHSRWEGRSGLHAAQHMQSVLPSTAHFIVWVASPREGSSRQDHQMYTEIVFPFVFNIAPLTLYAGFFCCMCDRIR